MYIEVAASLLRDTGSFVLPSQVLKFSDVPNIETVKYALVMHHGAERLGLVRTPAEALAAAHGCQAWLRQGPALSLLKLSD